MSMDIEDSFYPDLGIPLDEFSQKRTFYSEENTGIFFKEGEVQGTITSFVLQAQKPTVAKPGGIATEFTNFCELYATACCRVVCSYEAELPVSRLCDYCMTNEAVKFCIVETKVRCNQCPETAAESDLDTLIPYFKDNRIKNYTGSAFRVSSTKLLTARHVVKPRHILSHPVVKKFKCIYTLCQVKVISHHASDVTLGINSENDHEVEVLPPFQHGAVFPEKWIFHTNEWKTPFDFAFLRFKSTPPPIQKLQIATPKLVSVSSPVTKSAIFGYFSIITLDKFLEDYCPDTGRTSHFKNMYYMVMRCFNRLMVSESDFTYSPSEPFVPHKCPTIRGSSGGLFICCETPSYPKKIYFSGIHLGGNEHVHNNIMTPLTHALGLAYICEVLTEYDEGLFNSCDWSEIAEVYRYHKHFVQQLGVIIEPTLLAKIEAQSSRQ